MDRRISLYKLDVLLCVARVGSVTRAAEELFIAQPAVSAHLRSLERQLGVTLFQRQGRGLTLSLAGQRVVAWASDVVTRSHELDRELEGLQGPDVGTCVVAASMSVGSYTLPEIVTGFHRDRPRALVRVVVSDPESAMDAVRSGGCDLAVIIVDLRRPTEGLHIEQLWEDELVLVGSPTAGPAGGPGGVQATDLRDLPFVASPRGVVRRDSEDQQLRAHDVERTNIVTELGHPEAMKRAVAAGLGVSFLFRDAVEVELRAGTLREIPVEHLTMRVPVYLVHRATKQFTPVQHDFAAALRQRARALVPAEG